MDAPFRFDSPHAAISALLERIHSVESEPVSLELANGRVLAQPICADRDSPPCDVSMMDGFAVRLREVRTSALPVTGQARIGQPAITLPPGVAWRIYTGSPMPVGGELVIPKEDVREIEGRLSLCIAPDMLQPGQYIRRRGENLAKGQPVLPAGATIQPAAASALAAFGAMKVDVFRKVRVGVIVTGDELRVSPSPWQIRDSNGPALRSLLASCPRVELSGLVHQADIATGLSGALAAMLDRCDLVILTGGVSMGDYDLTPDVVSSLGAEVVFHGLPIRPGKPILAATTGHSRVILGLPGNPVSVLITACRFGRAVVRCLSGMSVEEFPPPVKLGHLDSVTLKLWQYPLVRMMESGTEVVPSRGSGDMVSAGQSDGFVQVPPGQSGAGPWPFYRWEL